MGFRDNLRDVLAHAARIGPYQGGVRVALRAAVSLGGPLVVLLLLGRLDLGLYASFAAFAAVYGRFEGYAARVWMHLGAGIVLVCSLLAGTLLSYLDAPVLVRVLGVGLVAAGVTWLAASLSWHPPGALFATFASGATAALPATIASFAHAIVIGSLTVAFTLIVTAGLAIVRRRTRELFAHPPRPTWHPQALPVALTMLIGTTLSGAVGLVVAGGHWYWAMVAAAAALAGAHVKARVARGIQRFVGTIVGVLLAAGIMWLDLPHWALVIIVLCLQGIVELLMAHNYAIAMTFATGIALIMVQMAASADPVLLVRDRVLDTLVGVTVGTIVAVVSAMWRRRLPEAQA